MQRNIILKTYKRVYYFLLTYRNYSIPHAAGVIILWVNKKPRGNRVHLSRLGFRTLARPIWQHWLSTHLHEFGLHADILTLLYQQTGQ